LTTPNGSATAQTALTVQQDGVKNFHNTRAVNLADPTQDQDAATKKYVDDSSGPTHTKIICQYSHRVFMFSDRRWVTHSVLQGTNAPDMSNSAQNAINPTIVDNRIGIPFPSGTILKRLFVKGESNNSQVANLNVFARTYSVDFSNPNFVSGPSNLNPQTILPETTVFSIGTGNSTTQRSGSVSLGDYTMAYDGDVHLFFRSSNAPWSTYFYYVTYFIEALVPA
jgi:hypothetical protein